jgi:hypothetical protein
MPKRKMTRTTVAGQPAMVSVTVKMDARMGAALQRLADTRFISVSGLLKQGAEKVLLEHGINWREEEKEG